MDRTFKLGNRYSVDAAPRGVEHYTLFTVTRRDGVVVTRDISYPDFESIRTREEARVRAGELPRLAFVKGDAP